MKIAKEAIDNELSNAVQCQEFEILQDYGAFVCAMEDEELAEIYKLAYAMHYCNFTIVTHCVGFHNDVGKHTATSFLENRMVLTCPADSNNTMLPEGRGGGTQDTFSYAILDWENKKKNNNKNN